MPATKSSENPSGPKPINQSFPEDAAGPSQAPTSGSVEKEAPKNHAQVISDLKLEAEHLLLSAAVRDQLRALRKGIPVLYDMVQREARRKTRSPGFRLLFDLLGQGASPVDARMLAFFAEMLSSFRMQLEGQPPTLAGDELLNRLQGLMKERKEPKYWREYLAHREGKSVSEAIRQFHPEYDHLPRAEKDRTFKNVYEGIRKLVDSYGGPPLSSPAKQTSGANQ